MQTKVLVKQYDNDDDGDDIFRFQVKRTVNVTMFGIGEWLDKYDIDKLIGLDVEVTIV